MGTEITALSPARVYSLIPALIHKFLVIIKIDMVKNNNNNKNKVQQKEHLGVSGPELGIGFHCVTLGKAFYLPILGLYFLFSLSVSNKAAKIKYSDRYRQI